MFRDLGRNVAYGKANNYSTAPAIQKFDESSFEDDSKLLLEDC